MAVRKKKETEMDNFLAPCLHEEGHPATQVNLSKLLYKKKVETLGTSQQCSRMLWLKLSSWASLSVYGEKLAHLGGWSGYVSHPSHKANFLFLMKSVATFRQGRPGFLGIQYIGVFNFR